MSERPAADATILRDDLAQLLRRRRDRTVALVGALDDDAIHGQFVDFLSPVVWDVGHVGNFEELWLLQRLGGQPSIDARLNHLYNAFENPRAVRGGLALLDRGASLAYLADVRGEVARLLQEADFTAGDPLLRDGYVHRMISQHESQHQETILQALDLRPDLPPYGPAAPVPAQTPRPVDDEDRITIPGGPVTIGTDSLRYTYDNERPAHRRDIATFAIDRFPTTVRRYAQFVAAGGYDQQEWWSERGWAWLEEHGHRHPQGWLAAPDGWRVRRFGYVHDLDPREPVQHLSFFEAEAFAAWCGGRLPSELEWEKAAGWDPAHERARRYPWGDEAPSPLLANVGLQQFGPAAVGSYPLGASAYGLQQCAGDVYEWTSSAFDPYPGFTAFPYAEYSEVFFGGDWRVLRGSSWAIAGSMARVTYRNWDHPYRRQLFAGVRVAWDVA